MVTSSNLSLALSYQTVQPMDKISSIVTKTYPKVCGSVVFVCCCVFFLTYGFHKVLSVCVWLSWTWPEP